MSGLGDEDPEDFPDRGPAVFAVTTATLALASVFVVARMISRVGIVRKVSWDDYIILLAWVLAFFLSFSINYGTFKGLGRHDSNIDPADKPTLRKCEYVFSVLYNPALMATKTSILVFYLRLAKNTQKILRLASWMVLGVVNVAGIILTFMNIFQCKPVEASWDIFEASVRCLPLLTEFICSAPVNIVTDLAILALPIPVLTGMRLPPRQKTILIITFALGVFVTVVDVVRIYYLQQAIDFTPTSASGDGSAIFGDTEEFAWNASLSLMWSAVEVNVGMACACIPTLKPLIVRILPSMLMDPNRTQRTSGTRESQYLSTSASSKQDSSEGSHPTTMAASQPATPHFPHSPYHPHHQPHHSHHPQHPAVARVQGSPAAPEELSMMDFLTACEAETPTGPPGTSSRRSQMFKRRSGVSTAIRHEDAVYFGFVNMKRPKSMLKTNARESFGYCAVVTILFLLWGFSYGLLNTLNNVVAEVAGMTMAETLGLTSAYFGGGYFFGPLLVGEWILRHDEHHRSRRRRPGQPDSVGGFKTTFIVGLLIYGTGTIIFWPSAVLTSFAGFLISSFVVGFGLGVLETAANPFLALCGPPDYAEARLCVAQSVQGVGSVLSGLLAENVFFDSIHSRSKNSSTALIDVQWTYLAVTLLCVLLALFFYYMPLPEVSDNELARAASKLAVDPEKRSIGGMSLRNWCIILAVLAQWTYVAAQECTSIFFHTLITAFSASINTDYPADFVLSVPHYLFLAHTAFAVSRFFAGFLAYLHVQHPRCIFIPTPRAVLATSTASSVVCMLLVVLLKPLSNPNLLSIPLILFFLAEGPLWPLIFALGLRGQGKRTKRAAAWLTMGGSGPAFWPFVQYAILRAGGSIQTAFVVVVVLLAVAMAYPLFLTFVRDARTLVDAHDAGLAGERERGDGTLTRRGSTVTEADINEIVAARARSRGRMASDATAQTAGTTGSAVGVVLARVAEALKGVAGLRRGTWGSIEPVLEQEQEHRQEGVVEVEVRDRDLRGDGDSDVDRDGDGDGDVDGEERQGWSGQGSRRESQDGHGNGVLGDFDFGFERDRQEAQVRERKEEPELDYEREKDYELDGQGQGHHDPEKGAEPGQDHKREWERGHDFDEQDHDTRQAPHDENQVLDTKISGR